MKENSGQLLRELGLKEALAIGLGTMIGAGIFVLPGIAVGRENSLDIQVGFNRG